MSDIAIRVENLGKQYRIGGPQARYKTIRESLIEVVQAPFRRAANLLRGEAYGASELDRTIWALKDVSFEVKRGEVVGIIGRNGAGKTTLLKVLSRITEPTEGEAEIHGRVGSLLEVGTGFHPELTGRENVYLNGAILGMRRVEIDHKFDEIVEFSGVEKFIDTPVKHYSSGMYVRLAFAVAAHLDPEILLVDEVLAVGDAAFQEKCLGKMGDVAQEGRTVLLVSHNMAAISFLCPQAMLIDQGYVAAFGPAQGVIDTYLNTGKEVAKVPLIERTDRLGDGRLRFTRLSFYNGRGDVVQQVASGQDLIIALDYECPEGCHLQGKVRAKIGFVDSRGYPLFSCLTEAVQQDFYSIPHKGRILCAIPDLPLLPGTYSLDMWCRLDNVMLDRFDQLGVLKVVEGDFFGTGKLTFPRSGSVLVRHSWRLDPQGSDTNGE